MERHVSLERNYLQVLIATLVVICKSLMKLSGQVLRKKNPSFVHRLLLDA